MISCDSNGGGRRIWGMTARQVHDRFWTSSGVRVVRQCHPQQVLDEGELFLLTDTDVLVLFDPSKLLRAARGLECDVLLVRVQQRDLAEYRELVITDDEDRFVRFERQYERPRARVVKVGLTYDVKLAQAWQSSGRRAKSVWRFLRNVAYQSHFETIWLPGRAYNDQCVLERERLVSDLIRTCEEPEALVPSVKRIREGVWASSDARIDPKTLFIGQVWVGAGRDISGVPSILGPAVLWDESGTTEQAAAAAQPPALAGVTAAPAPSDTAAATATNRHFHRTKWNLPVLATPEQCVADRPRRISWYEWSKRCFDIVFSLLALAVTLPLYPLIMLAIWREDGGPFFFVHRRETRGGREFGCLKFRTMRRDAEALRRDMMVSNTVDGPQFYVPGDPRITRVGRFLRRYYIDEWPQFINVLRGEMSVVGPRPSPFQENQYCPAWREARLSVRGGITGLWQIRRTRSRGLDFLEWIQFDLQYVRCRGWRMDLYILWRTVRMVAGPQRWRRPAASSQPATVTAAAAAVAAASAVDPVRV